MEAIVVFCCQALGAPRKDELGIVSVKRVRSAPRGVAFMEVLVEFTDNYARDDVLARGPMLADYRDDDNKPTAGIRLDIPQHLMGVFKTLEAFGFALKRRHQGLKKHIKFDEYLENLYIQVGLKKMGEEETEWASYTPEEAREGIKRLAAKKGPRFDFVGAAGTAANGTEESTSTGTTTSGAASTQTRSRRNDGGFPWVPPTRKAGQRWTPAAKDREEDETMA